jgi:hypothetical protein
MNVGLEIGIDKNSKEAFGSRYISFQGIEEF